MHIRFLFLLHLIALEMYPVYVCTGYSFSFADFKPTESGWCRGARLSCSLLEFEPSLLEEKVADKTIQSLKGVWEFRGPFVELCEWPEVLWINAE